MEEKEKILPKSGKRNILITSALPYVNNVPHLGNVVGSVLSADVFSRYCKARGYPTLFVCGTDEYGTATETKALEEGVSCQELCDKYFALHSQVYKWFNIGFDHFGRTPTQEQTDIAQDIFLKLNKNGYLEEKVTIQPYCEKHSSFLADRFVEGECPRCAYADARGDQCDKCGNLLDPLELINPRCKIDGATPVPRETKHVYILLDKLQPKIQEYISKSSVEGAWSSNGINISQSWLNEGLKPRGITRDLKWGTAVPLPGYENKVLYVWFDACIGYVSISATYTKDWELWWKNPDNVKLYQFMGKDNVPFHTVIFPGSQIGTGDRWTMLHHLSTTEYLNYEGGKFSKSRNIGVFGTSAEKTGVPSDVWRYYLISRRPETSDSEFEWQSFIAANNNELLKNFGNYINRVIKFVEKTYEGRVPSYSRISNQKVDENPWVADLQSWLAEANTILQEYITEMEAVKLRSGLVKALALSSHGNLLLQSNKLDNTLFATQPEKCATVVSLAISLCHLLASVIEPYMPSTARSILEQVNAEALLIPENWTADSIPPNHKIGNSKHLFTLIPATKEAEWRDMFGGDEAKRQKEEKAAAAASKKAQKAADKLRKQERKKQGENSEIRAKTVEAEEKETAQRLDATTEVDEVTKGVHQTALHPS